ncbi:MAG TPA: group 1 truncated hemoglobin [Polyangiales bacterium]|nr:group 1 truncated hemoglobin [Polyangiales bacterium]
MATMFERIGGEAALRAIVDDFVDRIVDDIMIGFFFRGVDRARLKQLEYQHAAEHLGGPVRYEGRPLRQAHAKHRIMGGQFARRKELLRKTLVTHAVPDEIASAWLAHVESLRAQVTTEPDGQCND